MAKLLPSLSDVPPATNEEPRVVGLDSEDADSVINALSSETARTVLHALHDRPDTPAELADRVDTTLQNVQYHIGKLEDAELVEVVDTVYSEKGREMKVYAPADEPLVLFAAAESDRSGIKETLMGLLGAIGLLGVVSLLIQRWAGTEQAAQTSDGDVGAMTNEESDQPEAADDAAMDADATAADEPGVIEQIVDFLASALTDVIDAIVTLEPGAAFFLGGLCVLLVGFAVWYRAGSM
ncbi:ArsR/SmtB family transcription factor [Halalkalirubrum salinum]|uniref:ArsR/SmtB family transcription factor n=1 Tax=Halalkalirubrum salinum TaxID=2563889 RepID=UPI0010FB2D0E|nr:helix-turn-helix domain-containing protein [Halalkalirubrum salinum]